jgi:hypothetical protein
MPQEEKGLMHQYQKMFVMQPEHHTSSVTKRYNSDIIQESPPSSYAEVHHHQYQD